MLPKPRRWSEERVWIALFAVLTGVSLLALAGQLFLDELDPSSRWSLGYGIAAAVALALVSLYAVRRRRMRVMSRFRAGRARSWLHGHLTGGLLFALLVLLHSSFQLPSGTLTWWLWGLSLWTVASGLVGLALQRWLPRVLASLSIEVLYERIPELVGQLRQRAQELAAGCSEPVQLLYERRLAPTLEGPQRRLRYYFGHAGIRARLREFEYLKGFLDDEERRAVGELELLYQAKLEMDAHYTLQRALRGWLALHAPLSVLLVVLVVVHILVVTYY